MSTKSVEGQPEPTFHGENKEAAVKRAREIKGRCVYSLAPGSKLHEPSAEWGYWSESADNGAFIRNWEQEIPLNETKKRRRA